MTFAMWSGIAVVAVSTGCFLLMRRADTRRGAAAGRANGYSEFGNSGADGLVFFSSDSPGHSCTSVDSSGSSDSSGSCDSGGGDGGGGGGSGD
jgi:hypothetical protein